MGRPDIEGWDRFEKYRPIIILMNIAMEQPLKLLLIWKDFCIQLLSSFQKQTIQRWFWKWSQRRFVYRPHRNEFNLLLWSLSRTKQPGRRWNLCALRTGLDSSCWQTKLWCDRSFDQTSCQGCLYAQYHSCQRTQSPCLCQDEKAQISVVFQQRQGHEWKA